MQVTGVSDPVAVVKKLADSEKRFDVVITDLRMPMFSGRGVLALASALPELPVIIITAFGGPDVEAQALRLGAFAFLEKPVAAAQLIEVVKGAFLGSPKLRRIGYITPDYGKVWVFHRPGTSWSPR